MGEIENELPIPPLEPVGEPGPPPEWEPVHRAGLLPDGVTPFAGSTAGIPFPASTDPVAAGAANIQALADYMARHGRGDQLDVVAVLPNPTDLNTLTKTGLYFHVAGTNGPQPGSNYLFVEVLALDAANITQVCWNALVDVGGQRYTRQKASNAWTPWVANPAMSLAGIVTAAGGISSGIGFTVAKPATGVFDITFAHSFPLFPAVVATPSTASAMTYCVLESISWGNFRVRMVNSAGGAADVGFHFIAMNTG